MPFMMGSEGSGNHEEAHSTAYSLFLPFCSHSNSNRYPASRTCVGDSVCLNGYSFSNLYDSFRSYDLGIENCQASETAMVYNGVCSRIIIGDCYHYRNRSLEITHISLDNIGRGGLCNFGLDERYRR